LKQKRDALREKHQQHVQSIAQVQQEQETKEAELVTPTKLKLDSILDFVEPAQTLD